jgi:hypothetical protein
MGWPGVGEIGILSFDLGGGFNWKRTGLGQARGDANGNGQVYVNDPQGDGVTSYDAGGNVVWHVDNNDLPGGTPGTPALGPDGTYYVTTSAAWWFHAIDGNGAIKWSIRPYNNAAYPIVRSDNSMVVAGGFAPQYVDLNVVQAFDTQTSEQLWSVDLPFADGTWKVSQQWYGEFSNDERTVYIPTAGTEAGDPFSFLYAIDVTLTGETVLPDAFDVMFGGYQSGTVQDLHESDDSYLVVEQRPAFSPLLPLIRVEADGVAEDAGVAAFTAIFEAAATSIPGLPPQKLGLYNHDAGLWETVDARTASSTDAIVEVLIDTDAGRFIQAGTNAMSMRGEWFDPGNVFFPAWGVRIDQMKWEMGE